MTGLIKSEILKIRTTNVWWVMMIALAVYTGISLLFNCLAAGEGMKAESAGDEGAMSAQSLAANLYTSGQFVGLLLAMIMGVLIITNEFQHQTATPTFLTTPHRPLVISAKVIAALFWGAVFALLTAAISIPVGAAYLSANGHSTYLGDSDVLQPILLNVLAYAIWAVFGLGVGTLVRNQIGAIATAMVLYLIAENVVRGLLFALSAYFEQDWILQIYFYLPSGASAVMTGNLLLPPNPPQWWAGALVLTAYGAAAGLIGTLITAKRDVA